MSKARSKEKKIPVLSPSYFAMIVSIEYEGKLLKNSLWLFTKKIKSFKNFAC
jgi:hypothetical protein